MTQPGEAGLSGKVLCFLAAAQPTGMEARRALKTRCSSLPPVQSMAPSGGWSMQAQVSSQSLTFRYTDTNVFFFFTILFITISVLFSCKGIQQKLLKRSCPQNGAARLPFLGVPHFLLIPRGEEPGGGVVYQRKSPALGATVGALEKGRACLGGMLSAASQRCPWSGGWGMGWPPPKKN